jgi:hypothetical protein
MVFGRVDEGSIHVPEYCSIHGLDRPVAPSVRISGVLINLANFKLGSSSSPDRFSDSSQGELLEAMGIAVELANAFP